MVVQRKLIHPARVVPAAFVVFITVGTALLMLPASRAGTGGGAPWNIALFTATGAATGALSIVDTGGYWTGFGQVVVAVLMQVGGFGIMTLATLLGVLVSRRLGLSSRLLAQSESQLLSLADLGGVLVRIAATTAVIELITAAVIAVRLAVRYHLPAGTAAWHGVFHSISAFNNAGFALYPDNLMRFVADPWIALTIALAALLGGIGFPVLFELRREWRKPSGWSIHTKLTMLATGVLILIGVIGVLGFEWGNPGTLGRLNGADKVQAAVFAAVSPRTAGFNTIDYARASPETLALTDALMFIGGGSAGTAGGIKVTTFFLLGFVILAEVRGERDVTIFNRRVGGAVQRQALTVALLGVAVVAVGTFSLMALGDQTLDEVLFNTASAFGSAGMTIGIDPALSIPEQLVLVAVMFIGRVGPVATATAFALRSRRRLYRLPEERPIVG
jgi:Trk-type K+ transport system membrane component